MAANTSDTVDEPDREESRERDMPASISDRDIQRYRRDGYLCPIDILTLDVASRYRALLEASEAATEATLRADYRHKPHLVYLWAQELIRHPRILDAVEAIIGPDILVWESVIFAKGAHTDDFVSWHQDITYWGLDHEGSVVTAWLALSKSTVESGCMKVARATHLRDVIPHSDTYDRNNMLSRGQQIAVDPADEDVRALELEPGQMSLHHVKIFHGSDANRSDDSRIGLAIRYLPPSVRRAIRARDSATLVRGEDRYGRFELEPSPSSNLDPSAVDLHRDLRARRMSILMRNTDDLATAEVDEWD